MKSVIDQYRKIKTFIVFSSKGFEGFGEDEYFVQPKKDIKKIKS